MTVWNDCPLCLRCALEFSETDDLPFGYRHYHWLPENTNSNVKVPPEELFIIGVYLVQRSAEGIYVGTFARDRYLLTSIVMDVKQFNTEDKIKLLIMFS